MVGDAQAFGGCLCAFVCVSVCMCVHVCAFMFARLYVCAHTFVYVCCA